MAVIIYILAILATATAEKYLLQCTEKEVTPEDASWIYMGSGRVDISDGITADNEVMVDLVVYCGDDLNWGQHVNICGDPPSEQAKVFLKAAWDILQIEQSECPIKSQEHEYAKNITTTYNHTYRFAFKPDDVSFVARIYQTRITNPWLNIWYKCKATKMDK